MKRIPSLVVALVSLLSAPIPVTAGDDAARAIIERAIKAHGGQERLEKLKAERVTLKGTMTLNEKPVEFTGETTLNPPSQMRSVTELMLEPKPRTIVQLLNGEKAVVAIDGQPQPVVASGVQEIRDIMMLNRAARLTPLLSDKGFELTVLDESKVNDKPVVGVQVRLKNHTDLKMYFDKESGLLVKTEHLREESKKKVTQEEFYSEYRDVDGYKRPKKTVVHRGGKPFIEMEEVEVKYLDKVDETLFTKP
jgi:hypothetical protein